MEQRCDQGAANCKHYTPEYEIGFKMISPRVGEHYIGHVVDGHSLVFMLEGEVLFSYNDFLDRRFIKGDIFFIPQSAEIFGTAISNSKMLVLSFNNSVESLCDRCRLSQSLKYISEIRYNFRPLRFTPTINSFVKLVEEYIKLGIKCHYLHEMKQKELFIIMGAEFSEYQLLELFYPIVGGDIDFKSRILENYHYGVEVLELANILGMSYSPFQRRFKKEFGESTREWMQKQRAKHIKLRLSLHTTTISDVIREFGFTDSSHFVRFCHRYYGLTPKELIKSIRSGVK